jgi:polysaccharide export outer membrane protein
VRAFYRRIHISLGVPAKLQGIPVVSIPHSARGGVMTFPKLLLFPLLAAFCSIGNAPVQAQEPDAYRLAPGDSVTVTVFGQPDLSVDLTLDVGGNIHLPLGGAVQLNAATLDECAHRISTTLADGYLKHPEVSVRLKEARPVYVLGDVQTPGTYPFRFGLSALGAVAMAGGFGTLERRGSAAVADLLTAEERLKMLASLRQSLLIRLSRLNAESERRLNFALPDTGGLRGLDALAAKEQDQLKAQLTAHEHAVSLLKVQKSRMENEIAALKNQIESETRQVRISEDAAKEYDKIAKQGLSRPLTQSDLQFRQRQSEIHLYNLRGDLSRLEAGLRELDVKIQETENAFRLRIAKEIGETQLRLGETDLSLSAARDLLEFRRRQTGTIAAIEGVPAVYDLHLRRTGTPPTLSLTATEETRLQPGDILEVKRIKPGPEKLVQPAS